MDDQDRGDDREPVAPGGEPEDVEGHSLAYVIGLGQLERNRQRARSDRPKDDALPPLTKPFPRLKDPKGR